MAISKYISEMFSRSLLCKEKYGPLRKDLGDVFRELALQRECEIRESHPMKGHVLMISIPLKCGLYQALGSIKAKAVIYRAEKCSVGSRNFSSQNLQAMRYYVTIGRDETGHL